MSFVFNLSSLLHQVWQHDGHRAPSCNSGIKVVHQTVIQHLLEEFQRNLCCKNAQILSVAIQKYIEDGLSSRSATSTGNSTASLSWQDLVFPEELPIMESQQYSSWEEEKDK